MQPFCVPAEEINTRLAAVQAGLQAASMEGLFIAQRVDLLYFSGTAQDGYLYIPSGGQPTLFIRRYLPRARRESPLKQILAISSIKAIPGLIADGYGRLPSVCGLEYDVLPVRDFLFFQRIFGGVQFADATEIILRPRQIKSAWEIEKMAQTAAMTRQTFAYMQSALTAGLTEMEFAGMYETVARRLGHGGGLRVRNYRTEGYAWHVLSGENGGKPGVLDSPASGQGTSLAFPCGAGSRRLRANEPIMIDLGSVRDGYHLDETRMFAIGSMPKAALAASQAAIAIHDAVIEKIRPGITGDELYRYSLTLAEALGVSEAYLGSGANKVRFIGHGIGLELIEPPIVADGSRLPLAAGMTLAIEPKLMVENEFSAGIESVVLVTPAGSRLISQVPARIFIC